MIIKNSIGRRAEGLGIKLRLTLCSLLYALCLLSCNNSEQELTAARGLMQQGKFREALTPLNQAIEADADNVDAFVARGVAYFELREYGNAQLDYEQAIKLKPDFYRPYYNRALLRTAQNDVAGALKDYSEAIRFAPDTARQVRADLFLNRGQLFAQEGQLQPALNDFEQAITLNPKNALAYYNRGNLLFTDKQLVAATTEFQKAVQTDPKFGKAFYALGLAQALQGQQQAGCLSLEQARKLGYADAPNAIAQYCQ